MTHRDPRVAELCVALTAHSPCDDREARSRERFLAALTRLPAPFDETAAATHVTASAVVVGTRGVILHKHKRLGLWLQPGGHVDAGEHPAQAARREVREETGLEARHQESAPLIVHVDVHDGGRGHTHLDLRYLMDADPDDPCPPEGESPDVRWFPWDEALAVADEGLAGALRQVAPTGRPGRAR